MFSHKLTDVSGVDLIILPEMFTTGFSMAAEQLAEEMDGKAVNWMRRSYNCHRQNHRNSLKPKPRIKSDAIWPVTVPANSFSQVKNV